MFYRVLSVGVPSVSKVPDEYRKNFKSLLSYSSVRMGYVEDVTTKVTSEEMFCFSNQFLTWYAQMTGEDVGKDRVKYPVSTLNWSVYEGQINLEVGFSYGETVSFVFSSIMPPKKSHGGGMINNVANQRRLELSKIKDVTHLPKQQLHVVGESDDEGKLFQEHMNALGIDLQFVLGNPRVSFIVTSGDKEINIHTKTAHIAEGEKVPNSTKIAKDLAQRYQYPVNLVINNMRQDALKNIDSLNQAIRAKDQNEGFCIDWRIGSNQLKILKTSRDVLELLDYKETCNSEKTKQRYRELFVSERDSTVSDFLGDPNAPETSVKDINDAELMRRCVKKLRKQYFSVLEHVNHFFINSTEINDILSKEELSTVPNEEGRALNFCELLVRQHQVTLAIVTDGANGAALGGRVYQENTPVGFVFATIPIMTSHYEPIRGMYQKYNDMGYMIPISREGNTTGCGDSVSAAMEFSFRCKEYEGWLTSRRLQFAQFVAAMVYCLEDSNLLCVPQDCINELVTYFERNVASPKMGYMF